MPASNTSPAIYECANCSHRAAAGDLPDARDLSQRLEPGSEFTDRECPHCGALCFPLSDEDIARVEKSGPRLLAALEKCEVQMREYVSWHHRNSGGCSVEIESAWEEARASIAEARGQ